MNNISTKEPEVCVPILEESDVAMARKQLREIAEGAGLQEVAREALAIAVSEIARNIFVHAGQGEIHIRMTHAPDRCGVVVTAVDNGPGIANLQRALEDGYSTSNSLGLGLSSAMRLVDEFEIASDSRTGTIITMRKWRQ